MSGSYHLKVLETNFAFDYQEIGYKIFRDPEQQDKHLKAYQSEAHTAFLESVPSLEKLFQKLQSMRLPIAPYNPFLEEKAVNDPKGLGDHFPMNLALTLPKNESRFQRSAVFTITQKLTAAQLASLHGELEKQVMHRTESDARDVATAEISGPMISYRLGKYFGYAAGFRGVATPDTRAHFQKILDRWVDRVFPLLSEKLSSQEAIAAVGLSGVRELSTLGSTFGTKERPITGTRFNLYGPLYDDLARERIDSGLGTHMILFAPAKIDANRERPGHEFMNWFRKITLESSGQEK